MSATFAALGSVAEFVNGAAFKPEDWAEHGRRIIRIQNLTDPSKPFNRTSREVPSKLHVQPGDLLVSWSASLGVFEWEGPDVALLNQHIFRVLPNHQRIDTRYLRHALERALDHMQRHLHGATMQHVNRAEFLSTKVYLPPLAEQRRIARMLDKADALRRKRRAAIALVDTLRQSIFLDMFGDPATNTKGMKKEPLGKLIKLRSGDFLAATEMAPSGVYPVFGGNGISGYHDSYTLDESQIVIGRVGAYCGCVHVSPPKSWVTDNALYVSHRDEALSFDYLLHALTHARLNQYASKFGQPLVSGSRIYPVEILVPPEELQAQFAARARLAEALVEAHETSTSTLNSLFASLQHRALRGEL